MNMIGLTLSAVLILGQAAFAALCHTDSESFQMSGTLRAGMGQKGEMPSDGYYRYPYVVFDHAVCVKAQNWPNGVQIKPARLATSETWTGEVGRRITIKGQLGDASTGNNPEIYVLLPSS